MEESKSCYCFRIIIIIVRCKGFSFHCNNNKCISEFLTCNGKDDCGDNSDETANCPPGIPYYDVLVLDYYYYYTK